MFACVIALFLATTTNTAPAWSAAALVRQGSQPVVRFQARIDGGYLFVRATHEQDWHTYAMDNQTRAERALQGKKSLGIEQGITIQAKSGLRLDDQWSQTRPHDLSKPELRWYTYGFDRTAHFACRIAAVTNEPIVVRIQGQACSGESCRNIDVFLELQEVQTTEEQTPQQAERLTTMLKDLVPVVTQRTESVDAP